ncbi:hypothetical protein Bbelb_300000 [Branchiostoma belcheri]|nr:hypothetical protein Bbelb_300000 [Branchiostoma belcheri]
MSKRVTTVDNSPQKWSYTFIEGKDIDLWLSAEDESKIAGGRKSSKEYKILFEHSKTISVDIEHVRAVFRDRVLNQATDGIQGETSFFVVTDVFAVDKVRCESSKRVDDHLEAKFNFRKGPGRLPGMGMNARRNRTAEISQSSDTQIALYMKCVEVKYDPTTEKISEIVRCDPSTFRNSYTVMDSRSHFPRYQYVNNGSLIACKLTIFGGTKTSADVFLRLVDQDENWSDEIRFKNPWWRRRFTADAGGYSEVVRVQYRDTDGPNNNGQSPGDLVSKVKVWHDNSGFSPGWFLKKVVVQNLKTGLQQEFPFYRWLSRGRDDNRIAREVAMNGSGDGQVRIYKVRGTTVDKWSAASSSPVVVRLDGNLGQSERIQVLGELKRGRDTEFTIVTANLGELQGVHLSLRNKGSPPLATERLGTWISKTEQRFHLRHAAVMA